MKIIPIFILLILMVGGVSAVPVTQPATLVGNNNFTLNGDGAAAGTYYFRWGVDPIYMPMKTVEQTGSGGVISYREWGSPITPSTDYYYVACDQTGCDETSEQFTTTVMVPLTQTTLSHALDNMTESKFNMLAMPENIAWPYTVLMPENRQTMFMIVVFVMMMFLYVGMWFRTRGVPGGVVLALITSSFFFSPYSGLNLGLPQEVLGIAEGIFYASVAGVFLALLKK